MNVPFAKIIYFFSQIDIYIHKNNSKDEKKPNKIKFITTNSKLIFLNTNNNYTSVSKKQYWKNSKSLNFPRVSPMIREFVQSVDDREWQSQLFSLLQSQSYNQCEVDLFELMCKVLDQNLFSQVDWARNTVFFKDLKVSTFN